MQSLRVRANGSTPPRESSGFARANLSRSVTVAFSSCGGIRVVRRLQTLRLTRYRRVFGGKVFSGCVRLKGTAFRGRTSCSQDESASAAEGYLSEHKRCPQG